jgi:hypothetical protein
MRRESPEIQAARKREARKDREIASLRKDLARALARADKSEARADKSEARAHTTPPPEDDHPAPAEEQETEG